jgi:hypothetical protein
MRLKLLERIKWMVNAYFQFSELIQIVAYVLVWFSHELPAIVAPAIFYPFVPHATTPVGITDNSFLAADESFVGLHPRWTVFSIHFDQSLINMLLLNNYIHQISGCLRRCFIDINTIDQPGLDNDYCYRNTTLCL